MTVGARFAARARGAAACTVVLLAPLLSGAHAAAATKAGRAAASQTSRHRQTVRGIVPPANPASDAPSLHVAGAQCPQEAASIDEGAPCTEAVLRALDAARSSESLPALRLPTNWGRLTPAEQLFVLTDLERVARGLPPYLGLSTELDAVARRGALTDTDPLRSSAAISSEAGMWAGDEVSTLAADYDWLYDDGYGSGNRNCTSPGATGCWTHRDAVLGKFTGLECTDCVVGASEVAEPGGAWRTSLAEVIVAPSHPGALPVSFTWRGDVAPYLPRAAAGRR